MRVSFDQSILYTIKQSHMQRCKPSPLNAMPCKIRFWKPCSCPYAITAMCRPSAPVRYRTVLFQPKAARQYTFNARDDRSSPRQQQDHLPGD